MCQVKKDTFGLKDNSTHFLLAVIHEGHWLHTVNVNKLMIQKQVGENIQRLFKSILLLSLLVREAL